MTYREGGAGSPIVFLHGNPMSSRVWRDVLPHVGERARCLAPDLIGMGDSGKPDIAYRFADHARYLDAWFDALSLGNVILVGYDWGGALAMDWAARHPDRVRGLVVFETFLRPMEWNEWPPRGAELFRSLRTPGVGEKMVLELNQFLGRSLSNGIQRRIGEDEAAAYYAPYSDAASRRPLLQWPREIPIDGEPADVTALVDAYAKWLSQSPLPKLFINGNPGSILVGAQREFCRAWPNQQEVTVRGSHFLQEDSPADIGQAIARFLRRL